MVSSAQVFTSLLAVAIGVSAAPVEVEDRGASTILGYRAVKKAEADIYKKAGNTLVYTDRPGGQLAQGIYTSPGIGQWPHNDDDWLCAILGDSTAWNGVNKAWVPETFNGKAVWYHNENLGPYLTSLDPSFQIATTALLSTIDGFPQLQQLLIPKQLIGPNSGQTYSVQCAKANDQAGVQALSVYGEVQYSQWDIKGTAPTPESSTSSMSMSMTSATPDPTPMDPVASA